MPTIFTLPPVCAALLTSCGVLALSFGPAAPAAALRPLETGVFDQPAFTAPDGSSTAFARTRMAGATSVRLWLIWAQVAPGGETKPPGFQPRNHDDPHYQWAHFDRVLQEAHQHGLTPMVTIIEAPRWAERGREGFAGMRDPDPQQLEYFAEAAATRYSGEHPGIPRVRHWNAWNEPNLATFLVPQYDAPVSGPAPPDAKPLSPLVYRRMLQSFARGVHRVSAHNLVVAGSLAPFGDPGTQSVAPLRFMRELLCMNRRNRPVGDCKPLRFDVWAHHPYTEGGPTHHAQAEDNVSLGDLPQMRRLLEAAIRSGRVSSRVRVAFWVTEFSWDTKPPDPEGVPAKLHARWVAEALYRMWRQRISAVFWFRIIDGADREPTGLRYESGFYSNCGSGWDCAQPKRSFVAFRFPFVAFHAGRRVRVWGRTPPGAPREVVIEQRYSDGWRRLHTARADRTGIFRARPRAARRGAVRARLAAGGRRGASGRVRSLPFKLKRPPDRTVSIFGS